MVSTPTLARRREIRLARLMATHHNLILNRQRILNRERILNLRYVRLEQTLWLRLEQTIRLVVLRLGLDRDMRDLIVSLCIPSGTIVNPFVLF